MAEPRPLSLPGALEGWRVWLSLLPPDLTEPLSALLLRLHPLVGRLNSAKASRDDTPQGVGSIVRRGQFERMLQSEWAMFDNEPHEFLRRVANQELLFVGPEPEARRSAQRCVVLFDSGPEQIGEPRIVHLALFILLARRAQEAGAMFQWGILQEPATLQQDDGLQGLKHLIKARTATPVGEAHIAQWNLQLAEMGGSLRDCWQIGAPAAVSLLARMSARVTIAQQWCDPRLAVQLIQRHTTREVLLDLPESAIAIRLLRDPFVPLADPARQHERHNKPSLKQPPLFSNNGERIVLAMADGNCKVFTINRPNNTPPPKPRLQRKPAQGAIIGALLYRKSFATIISANNRLRLAGFPGMLSQRQNEVLRPLSTEMRVPAGMARWLPVFYQVIQEGWTYNECIYLLDFEQRLVCWEYHATTGPKTETKPVFSVLASKVVGAVQIDRLVHYAFQDGNQLQVYIRSPGKNLTGKPELTLTASPKRVLFGGHQLSGSPPFGPLLALQLSEREWQIVHKDLQISIPVDHGAKVIGVVATGKTGTNASEPYGLLILGADKTSIRFQTSNSSHLLAASQHRIAHALFEPFSARLAWLTYAPNTLEVLKLTDAKPLLHISFAGDTDEA